MPPRTHVREHERRTPDGDTTVVREHDRTLKERDRRDGLIDGIRREAAQRRLAESRMLDLALREYLDARRDGASPEEAFKAAERVLYDEMNGSDFRFGAGDEGRMLDELDAMVAAALAAGRKDVDTALNARTTARRSIRAASARPTPGPDEERVLTIGDAVPPDDRIVSLEEAAGATGREAEVGGRPFTVFGQAAGLVDDTRKLGKSLNELGREGLAEVERRKAERAAKKTAAAENAERVRDFATKAAAERRVEAGIQAGGPVGKKPGSATVFEGGVEKTIQTAPPHSVTTVPKDKRRIIGDTPAAPAPRKGAAGPGGDE